MRSQHSIGREIKGIHLLARGMTGGNVERLEVVPCRLDLGSGGDPEAHSAEDVEQVRYNDREWVPRALPAAPARKRDVYRLREQPVLEGCRGQGLAAFRDDCFDRLLGLVDALASRWSLRRWQGTNRLRFDGQRPLLTENADPYLLDIGGSCGSCEVSLHRMVKRLEPLL